MLTAAFIIKNVGYAISNREWLWDVKHWRGRFGMLWSDSGERDKNATTFLTFKEGLVSEASISVAFALIFSLRSESKYFSESCFAHL